MRCHPQRAVLLPILALLCPLFCLAGAADNDGFIYGQVVMKSGSEYKGFLRWGTEEAFWDDIFHSLKEDLPYDEYFERHGKRRSSRSKGRWQFKVFDISWESDDIANRIYMSRFGDIEKIRVIGSEDAEILMKTGQEYEVSGYANDVGGTIYVRDPSLGDIDLRWNRIKYIEFMPAPANEDPGDYRLHGTVETDSGEFEGFIQWDKQECLGSDILDGESVDGDLKLKFSSIRSIKRRGRRGSEVELKDGRSFNLRGTNDVNNENRGIMVEDERYGRLTIAWSEFDQVTFSDPQGSGRSYDSFKPVGELIATVTESSGDTHHGRIIFDLDESENWEMLNGSFHDIAFDIPFSMIKSIEPLRYDECKVTLHNGEELRLEDSQDVSERNDGILVIADEDDDDPIYIEWDDVELIEFSK